MLFKFPIVIEKRNVDTEQWEVHMPLIHARVNKNTRSRGYEALGAGAIQIKRSLIFEVRYNKKIREIAYNTQLFRIKYDDEYYNIIDYDDYKEEHRTVTLAGAYYG